MVESCRVELRAEATGLQPAYPVPGLKLSMEWTTPDSNRDTLRFKRSRYAGSRQ